MSSRTGSIIENVGVGDLAATDKLIEFNATTIITKFDSDDNNDPEDDDRDPKPRAYRALTTSETAAVTDQESDPEEDFDPAERASFQAMTTTLTESAGDNEVDPDDDVSRPFLSGGSQRPLAYRFSEQGVELPSSAPYDPVLQMHVLPNGVPIIDLFLTVAKKL